MEFPKIFAEEKEIPLKRGTLGEMVDAIIEQSPTKIKYVDICAELGVSSGNFSSMLKRDVKVSTLINVLKVFGYNMVLVPAVADAGRVFIDKKRDTKVDINKLAQGLYESLTVADALAGLADTLSDEVRQMAGALRQISEDALTVDGAKVDEKAKPTSFDDTPPETFTADEF